MGGAAGHMAHPYDLAWVKTGSDLIKFFDLVKDFVEKKGSAAVKIDGVNVSFKLVDGPSGKEFAVDRGSLKPIDIEGITFDRIGERFPEGHGMRPAIATLLNILNTSLPSLVKELKALGMWDNPTLFLNTEYVAGTTNVTKYDENFLAIHGLNQFYEKTHSRSGIKRPGASRPEGDKSPSVEVAYDDAVMESFIKKLNKVSEDLGFKVYGSVPTERLSNVDIDYTNSLNSEFKVQITDDYEISKTLKSWLDEAYNPRYKVIKLKNGKKSTALNKQVYIAILNEEPPVADFIDESDAEAAIYGAVFLQATRLLGNDVLEGLTSPMGDVMNHEGIVIRDEKLFGPNPVKITGQFLLGGMASAFQIQAKLEEEEEIDLEVVDDPTHTLAIVPGAFKPPHMGHLNMVKQYADMADDVLVLISSPTKKGRTLPNGREITAEDSLKIWELLTGGMPNVSVEISSKASPMTAAYEYVGVDGPLQPGTAVILGASTKGDDWKRWNGAEKYVKEGVHLMPPAWSAVMPTHKADGTPFSATDMRALLGAADKDPDAIEALEEYVGEENVFDVLSILGIGMGIKEMSAMGGGAVSGFSAPSKKKKIVTRENMDLSIVDEVFGLFIERGIIK